MNDFESIIIENMSIGIYDRYIDYDCFLYRIREECWDDFLEDITKWFRERLEIRNFLQLNEVYEALGFKKIYGGYTLGWTDPKEFDMQIKQDGNMHYIEIKNVKDLHDDIYEQYRKRVEERFGN